MSEAHPAGYRSYMLAWFWLAVLTLLALGVSYTAMPKGMEAFLLVLISVGKVSLIAAIFMHLRFEKLNLIGMTLTPLILALILFSLMVPDTTDTAIRFLARVP